MQSSTAHPVACLNNLLCDQSRCCFIIIAHTQRDAVEGERHLANGFGVERLTDKIMSRLPLSALSAIALLVRNQLIVEFSNSYSEGRRRSKLSLATSRAKRL
jgi:hypothetical protein